MLTQKISDELNRKDHSKFHRDLLSHVRQLVDMSRADMQLNYANWDRRDDIFRSRRLPDKNDLRAIRHGEPTKMVVPLTFAQIQTFVAFNFSLMTQNERFFEFVPTGAEDHRLREVNELLVDRDLIRAKYPVKLYQFLLDIGKFGLGIFHVGWRTEKQQVAIDSDETQDGVLFGTDPDNVKKHTFKEYVKWEGNEIANISPYRFFPDTRLPLTQMQKGEFVAFDFEYSKVFLRRLQSEREVAGIEHIEDIKDTDAEVWRRRRLNRITNDISNREKTNKDIAITEAQVLLVPAEYETDDGEHPLGTDDFPHKFLIWYANDTRVVKLELMGYLHDNFTCTLSQLQSDQHQLINESLSDTVGPLQETIDWFINSRVESVTRTLDNQLIVDPSGVDMTTVINRNRIIQLKKHAARTGVDRYIKQLDVQDVTGNHLADARELNNLMQLVTGVNDNALGQVASGRRSATENRAANQGAASRLKMISSVIFAEGLNTLAQQLSMNLRQGLSQIQFIKSVGLESKDAALWAEFRSTPELLIGNNDFFVFDSTLPTEKGFVAQSLQEIFIAILQVPGMAAALDINPKALFDEIQVLRGIRNLERFSLQNQPNIHQQLIQIQNAANQDSSGTTQTSTNQSNVARRA